MTNGTSDTPLHLRIFLSSPGDVSQEREWAISYIKNELPYLAYFSGEVTTDVIAWDDPAATIPMLASETPQESVNNARPRPAVCDIVIVVFWSRMGTPLPAAIQKPDGSRYESGTEWEYLDAVQSTEVPKPQVLLYRREGATINLSQIDPGSADFEQRIAQFTRVNAFFDQFTGEDGVIHGGYTTYQTPEEFAERLKGDLAALVTRRLKAHQQQRSERADNEGVEEEVDTVEVGLLDLSEALPLPPHPFRRLAWYREEDARIFFGRNKEIKELLDAIKLPDTAPVILFCGESGIGKSSLLHAGLLPQLKSAPVKTYEVIYLRRDQALGLSGTLAQGLGTTAEKFVERWHAIEEENDRPLVVILDQVEESYTDLAKHSENTEIQDLVSLMADLYLSAANAPNGKLILSFRKEWLAEIGEAIEQAGLDVSRRFLKRLSADGIREAVQGPSQGKCGDKYNLTVSDDLPDTIAGTLLNDIDSPIGPTLSILLDEMWQQVKNEESPTFSMEVYDAYKSKGLAEYVDQQLEVLGEAYPDAMKSGLILDVLNYHVTDDITAAERAVTNSLSRYQNPDRQSLVELLLEACKKGYLLVSGETQKTTRLAHDTLATLIRQRYRDSTYPGQEAERIVQERAKGWKEEKTGDILDKVGLHKVKVGRPGMRDWQAHEKRLVNESQKRADGEKYREYAVYAGIALMLVIGGWLYYYEVLRFNVCNTTGNQLGWCRACIEQGGDWDRDQEDVSSYCAGASFALLDPVNDFVEIPAGTFIMGTDTTSEALWDGDEIPHHRVTIPVSYQLGKTEVTQAQWYAVMGENPSYTKGANLPVEQVSWNDIQEFLKGLNGISPEGYTFRLPTEAEWEYACRAGTTDPYGLEGGRGALTDHAWYIENAEGRTQPVASKGANGYGLYDMLGNVYEWTSSAYKPYDSIAVIDDPMDDEGNETQRRVVRGGSFGSHDNLVRCAFRGGFGPDYGLSGGGFRVVALPPSE